MQEPSRTTKYIYPLLYASMNWKKYLPDIVLILSFFAVTYLFFSPLYSGHKLVSSDTIQFKSMASEVLAYAEKGERVHWTNRAFGGMPVYFVAGGLFKSGNFAQTLNTFIRTVFPDPSGILFVSLLSFYILSRALKSNKWVGGIGALVFALGTFVLVSIEAGHNSKIYAYAVTPLILAGLVWIFNRKYWLGAIILALGLGGQIAANHIQITYYAFFVCLIYTLYQIVKHLKAGEIKSLLWSGVASVSGIIVALGMNYNNLVTTLEHSKETIRGGGSQLTLDIAGKEKAKSSGLDYDYATAWSYSPKETFTLIIPRFMGGSSAENLGDKSHLKEDKRVNSVSLKQVQTYWGNAPFTGGPIYTGAIAFFLFILGFFVLKDSFKWWWLALTIFVILVSWGKYSPGVYDFLFNNAPFFNKLRVPSMILLMMGLILAVPVMLVLNRLIIQDNRQMYVKPLLISTVIACGVILLFGVLGAFSYSFLSAAEIENAGAADSRIMELLVQDRKMLLLNDSFRSLFLILAAAALLFFFLKEKLKPWHLLAGLTVLVLFDLVDADKRYLNADDFEPSSKFERLLRPTETDKQILQDKSYYRVFDYSADVFRNARTSLHHNAVGGYSAAKLQRYQDLIDYQLAEGRENVLDLLNVKYITGKTETGQFVSQRRESNLGNAWFIDSLIFAPTVNEEMTLLNDANFEQVAILLEAEKGQLRSSYNKEGSAVNLTSYHPEKLTYNARVAGNKPQYAVFSEIFYKSKSGDGWRAYIDGKEVDYQRINYTFRGLEIPPGEHEVEFRYSKTAFMKRAGISKIFSALFILLVLLTLIKEFLSWRKTEDSAYA